MVRSRSPKGGDDDRRRSPPRRSYGEKGGRKEQGPISLLVRNIPRNCRYEDLRVPFAKFGPVRDIYMPKDYYSGEPKGFAFIEFFDSDDASAAQYHMNRKLFCGREIKVEPATDKRKRPEDMRRRTGVRVHSGAKGRDLSRHGRSRSRSHSRSPRHGGRDRSWSHSPAPRRHGDYSASPKRKEECQAKSSGQSKEHDNDKKLGPCTPGGRSERHDTDSDSNERRATPDYYAAPKRKEACQTKSPRQANEHDEDKKRISFSPDRNNRRDADNGHNERDDYSTSSKRKGERLSKSLRLSKEHDKDKKRRSYSRDDRSDCRDADSSFKERRATTDGKRPCPRQGSPRPSSGSHSRRRDACSASPKGKEERREQSPRQSKEHDKHRKRRSNTPDDRNDCHGADHSHNEMQGDCSTSPKIKEERQAKSSRESEECNKDTKGRFYAPHDRNDRHDAVNGSRDSNLHVDRKPVTPDGEGSHACRRSPRPSSGSRSRRRDDCSASPKRKEERRERSSKQSIEHKDEKRRSCTADDVNGQHNAVGCYKKKRDGYSASPKIKEECRAESPRPTKEREDNGGIDRTDADNGYNERPAGPDSASQKRMEKHPQAKSQSRSKEHDNGKKNRSYTHDNGKEHRDADNGSKERKEYSAAGKRKEERQASLPRQSKEHDEHKKRGSYTRDDRNDLRDADNCSKERKDYSAAAKRKEERQASLPRQSKEHDEHKKRGCYTRDDRNDLCDADNGSKEQRDYSAAGKRKEERQASLPRQSKEHDEHKKRGSYTPDDRDDPRDADNGSKERNDYSASRKRMEDHRAKSSRQSKEHDDDKKRGSYTPDDRSHHSDADNGSRERGDFSASGQRREDRGKSPRQLKEHGDNKKRGSYTPADRNDLRDVDNGCNEKLAATHDGSPGRRSPRPSCGSGSISEDKTRACRNE